jgi:tetratricopeptide (TPR) repeat protein
MIARDTRETFLRTIEQLTAERAAARPLVQELRSDTSSIWEAEVPASWRTAGFVQELSSAASDVLESDPRESLLLAQLALAVASSIPTDAYATPVQAQIEGTAWREIGTAHRYLSQYDAALRAYDAAHRSFAAANALAHDAAIVEFARAIALADLQRYTEALDLLAGAEPLFRSFGDAARLVKISLLKGNIYVMQGRLQEGRATYERALEEVLPEDLHTRAMLYLNLGQTCANLGDMNNGVLMLHHARQLLSDLGMSVEVNRTEWNLARVLLLNGEYGRATPILNRVRDFFLAKGMPEDAGLAGLDVADALIATGQPDRAREIVVQVLAEFTNSNLNAHALTALAYLRDVLHTTKQPNRAVRHVRQYLDQLRKEPARLFLPPAED